MLQIVSYTCEWVLCLADISSHRAPAGSFVSPWGRLTLPPPADPAAECPETPPSCCGHPGPGPQPAPQQLQVKPTIPSHSYRQQNELVAVRMDFVWFFFLCVSVCVSL